MKNDLLKSRFFTTEDKRMEKVIFPLPSHWWSRFYEYAWASEFCNKDDVVLDAACGIAHPFKFYLAKHCKTVYAIDNDAQIEDYKSIANEIKNVFGEDSSKEFIEKEMYCEPHCKQSSLTELPYKKDMFSKIFCISALEHLKSEDEQIKTLQEFNRVLKKDGMVILTLDYSTSEQYSSIDMKTFEKLIKKAGFKFAGEFDSSIPQNAINWDNILYCYRAVLIKDNGGR